MAFDSAWKFISKDWNVTFKFVLFTALLSLIPVIGGLIVMGLSIKVLSNLLRKKKVVIPDVFEDFGGTILEGLKLFVFSILISIPVVVFVFFMFSGSFAPIFNSAVVGDVEAVSNTILTLMDAVPIFLPVLVIFVLLYSMLIPALICNYVKKREFGAFFDLRFAFNVVFNHFSEFLNMFVVLFIYNLVLGFLSGVIIIVGPLLLSPFTLLVNAKIFADWFLLVAKK